MQTNNWLWRNIQQVDSQPRC